MMMRCAARLLACGVLAAATRAGAQGDACDSCTRARYWEIRPTFWKDSVAGFPAPERPRLDAMRPHDLGISFSGGGTRSASATIGELRALQAMGWLSRVRYVSAVSGGSWAAVPFTFHDGTLSELLGTEGALDAQTIQTTPNGLLAARVAASGLAEHAIYEIPAWVPGSSNDRRVASLRSSLAVARDVVRKIRHRSVPDADRRDKTYAHTLAPIFLEGVVTDAPRRAYAWDAETAVAMSIATGRPAGEFVVPPRDRPFLIVEGTAVKTAGREYPRLIPVEYTPLYTGVRQQFGTIGGTYVWPWAYDRLYAAPLSDTLVLVGPKPTERIFTLADVIASSGAAPQLALMLGDQLPARLRSAARELSGAFPSFANVAVRNAVPTAPTVDLAHGDGGFSDNLAVMSLLVRQVHNIIVFVNAAGHYRQSADLQSYFMPIAIRGGSGDKSMNPVFEARRYLEVIAGFDSSVAAGGAAIYCGRNWSVAKNELYNSRAYDGLNICWVYNHLARNWKEALPDSLRAWIAPAGKRGKPAKLLAHFPYYSTFEENKPRVIKLKALQVNLLADLASWSVSNSESAAAIQRAFGPVLPAPVATRSFRRSP